MEQQQAIEKRQEPQAPVAFGSAGFTPTDLEGAWRVATMVARSGLAPKNMQTPEAICVAAAMGAEIGLTFMQSIQSIAVINGRPSVWGDALLALVRSSGKCASFKEWYTGEGDVVTAHCSGKRSDTGDEAEQQFSMDDARRAGLLGKDGPWKAYPRRMLQMRARGFLCRDLWPDVLRGTISAEEAQDIPREREVFGTVIDRGTQPELVAPGAAGVTQQEQVVDAAPEVPPTAMEPPAPAEPPKRMRGRPRHEQMKAETALPAPEATPAEQEQEDEFDPTDGALDGSQAPARTTQPQTTAAPVGQTRRLF